MTTRILILLLFIFLSATASGAIRYVDSSATGANTGLTWTDAWTSFSAIVWEQLDDEESTLYISGGIGSKTYNEMLQIYHLPTAHRLFIKPGSASPSPANHSGMVIISNTSGSGIQIGHNTKGLAKNVTIDGSKSGNINFAIRGCSGKGIDWRFDNQSDIHIKFVEISECGTPLITTTTSALSGLMSSLTVANATGILTGYGVLIQKPDLTWETNAVEGVSGSTITLDIAKTYSPAIASGATIKFYKSNDGHGISFRSGSQGLIIEDCIIRRNQDGINGLYNGSLNTINMRRLQIIDNRDDGIQVGGGVTLEDSLIDGTLRPDGTGSIPEMHADAIQAAGGNWQVYRTRFVGTTQQFFQEADGINAGGIPDTTNITIANCEFVDSLGPAIALRNKTTTNVSRLFQNIKIYNNSFIDCTFCIRALQDAPAKSTIENFIIENNIFKNVSPILLESSLTAAAGQLLINRNLFSTDSIQVLGVTYTIANYQAATGATGNIVAADPLFVSSTNLALQTGSPAINVGANLGLSFIVARNGITRTGTWDLGANEFPATYYVRTDGVDTNNGLTNTAGGAFLTIAKAVTVAQAGDTISIQAGTFPERVTTARHGANGAPIIIQGQGDTTIFAGVGVNHDYIHIKDCQINPFGIFEGDVKFGESVNANKVTGLVGNYGLVDNVTFKGATARCAIFANTPYYTGPLQTHIKNSRFIDRGPGGLAVQLSGCGSIVENCYFTSGNSCDAAVGIFGRHNIVRSNVFENWRKSPTSSIHVDVFQSWTNNDETSVGQIIERNLIIGDGTGSALGQMTDLAASIYGAARQGSTSDWTFRNNIVIGHGSMFQFNIPAVKVYNNTFVSFPKDQGVAVLVRSTVTNGTGHNARIFNNIFYKGGYNTAATNLGFFDFLEDTGSVPIQDFQGNNNLVIGTGAGTVKSTAIWTKYGANANGLNGVDPLLANPVNPTTAADVRLLAGSPAIGAGANLSATGFTTDYYGNERGATWDIGAIEYNAGDTPTDTTPPTVVSKVIDSTGTELSLMFSENVINVAAAHYSLNTGNTLTYVGTVGSLAKFTISPIVSDGTTVTLSYTSGAGRTADIAGNLLASFSGSSVTNNSLEPTPNPPRAIRRGPGSGGPPRPVGR